MYPLKICLRLQDFVPNPPIPRMVPGHEPKQRPRNSRVEPQKEVQADNVYQTAHVGEIVAEMVRPNVSGPAWGGYDVERLPTSTHGYIDNMSKRQWNAKRR